jgi:hypothetical protein
VARDPSLLGVIAKEHEYGIVREFFELFKTPWEYYRGDEYYEVVLSSGDHCGDFRAPLTVIYGSDERSVDSILGRQLPSSGAVELNRNGVSFPIYYKAATFECGREPIIQLGTSRKAAGVGIDRNRHRIVRMGYDLFEEVAFLLSSKQPAEYAHIPTLEIHIAILRDLMIEAGVPFVEIPPAPYGYDFIACLTHDVDFINVRDHNLDRSVLGFVVRALFPRSLRNFRSQIAWSRLLRNWRALLSLPFVYLGRAQDVWFDFDRYCDIEKDTSSTYFFIPFNRNPGQNGGTNPPSPYRAARYDILKYKPLIQDLQKKGHEIGLHGIDAWRDPHRGQQEREVIANITGEGQVGVRMHWLYFSEGSPNALEKAGFFYDSSLGYNDAVGYRSGASQVFQLPGASGILELPLTVMDTALFYRRRMGLSEARAMEICKALIDQVRIYGGVITVNWHTRSLSPERNWDDFYMALVDLLRSENVWFASAKQAVTWFQTRRRIRFEDVSFQANKVSIRLTLEDKDELPPCQVRIHVPGPHPATLTRVVSKDSSSMNIPF